MNKEIKFTIGIDEAGRGPIAGPVAVGGCMIKHSVLKVLSAELLDRFMRGKLKDSKKLSEKKRDEIFKWMQKKQRVGDLYFAVSMGSAKTIDENGIVPTIQKAISIVLTKLMKIPLQEARVDTLTAEHSNRLDSSVVEVLLDGGLSAPGVFKNQKTIIRGDESEITISLASIAAKVTRDRYMKELSEIYIEDGKGYGFERHKGYGTKLHYERIAELGLCNEHRRSFCGKVINNED